VRILTLPSDGGKKVPYEWNNITNMIIGMDIRIELSKRKMYVPYTFKSRLICEGKKDRMKTHSD
jgi:hypothetical protein